MSTIPSSAVAAAFPVWHNIQDNWREIDAHWLRNRVVQIYPDLASRNAAMTGNAVFGMLSIYNGANGPEYFNASSAWESIRYPNLSVSSDATSVTMLRTGAVPATGVQFVNDGSVNIGRSFHGAGGVGTTLNNTGLSMVIGAKTVKLATDATALTIDSPVKITGLVNVTGGVTATGALTGASAAIAGVAAVGSLTSTSVVAATVQGTTTVQGGSALLGTNGVYGTLKNSAGGTSLVGVGSDSTVKIEGTAFTVTPPTTHTGATTMVGDTSFQGRAYLNYPGALAGVWVAGVWAAVVGTTIPSNLPEGTLVVLY